jgi:hypothetical protein
VTATSVVVDLQSHAVVSMIIFHSAALAACAM